MGEWQNEETGKREIGERKWRKCGNGEIRETEKLGKRETGGIGV